MSSPQQQDGRPSKALRVSVESLEGRRLPSTMGPPPLAAAPPPPPPGVGGSAGALVYRVDTFGKASGPDFVFKGDDRFGPPMDKFAGGGQGSMITVVGGWGATRTIGLGPPDRVSMFKMIAPGQAAWGGFSAGRVGDGDGDGPPLLSARATAGQSVSAVRVDDPMAFISPLKMRLALAENTTFVVFGRPMRSAPALPPPITDAPPMTEVSAAGPAGAMPIAAAPAPAEAVVAAPARATPAGAVPLPRGAGGPVELQDRRVPAVADRADPGATTFRASASGETTAAVVTLLPGGESVATAVPAPGNTVRVTRTVARRVTEEHEGAAPETAELLTHFLPLDRATLELAVDRVFGQLADLGPDLPELNGPIDWASASMVLLASGLAADLALRVLNRHRRAVHGEGEPDGEEAGYVSFPGLPGGWRLDER